MTDRVVCPSGVLSTIDVSGEACFDLRVVGWDGDGGDKASVYVDIQH